MRRIIEDCEDDVRELPPLGLYIGVVRSTRMGLSKTSKSYFQVFIDVNKKTYSPGTISAYFGFASGEVYDGLCRELELSFVQRHQRVKEFLLAIVGKTVVFEVEHNIHGVIAYFRVRRLRLPVSNYHE